jgi:hypothetical protein
VRADCMGRPVRARNVGSVGEPLWVRAIGVAGGGVDADSEEIVDAAQVATRGEDFVEDPVFSDEPGGHAELDAEPPAADRVESACGAVVDEEVAVGGGRSFRVAVVEIGGETSRLQSASCHLARTVSDMSITSQDAQRPPARWLTLSTAKLQSPVVAR